MSKAGWNKTRRNPDRECEGWVKLDLSTLALLDELITADTYGRVWNQSRTCCTVYDSSATAYTETELARLLGISVSALDSYLASNWAEHDIPAILDGSQTVQFNGEGVLLCRDLAEDEVMGCRLFTPVANWKPGAREIVNELERMFAQGEEA